MQIETLNKFINKFNKNEISQTYLYMKDGLLYLDKLLAMDNKAAIDAILDNRDLYLVNLSSEQKTLFMQMRAAKNADGTSVYKNLNNNDVIIILLLFNCIKI